jgi:hypothetical protein
MKLLLIFTLLFLPRFLDAQLIQQAGSIAYPYVPRGFSGKPNPDEVASAVKSAKVNALRAYMSSLDQNTRLNFEKIQTLVEADIDRFVPKMSLLRNDYDKKQKLIYITLNAAIDSSRIRDRITASGTAAQVPKNEKSYICGAFVARRQKSVTAFKEKVTTVSRDSLSKDELQEVATNGTQTSISAESNVETLRTTGGSSTTKSDEIIWDVFPSEILDISMSGILKTAGYRMVPAKLLGSKSGGLVSVEALKDDYSTGNDLSERTQENFVEGCTKLKITYLTTGTMSVQPPSRHPITGQIMVNINVNAQVLDLSGLFPEVVTSIGPVQYSALGDTQTTAENNAIKIASEEASRLIVAGLQQANAR